MRRRRAITHSPVHEVRFFSRDDIRNLVSMADMVTVMKEAFTAISSGSASVPLRSRIDVEEHDGVAFFMPGHLGDQDVLGVKMVTLFPGNREKGTATIHGTILIADGTTGVPTGIMDGGYLTALRTGAVSGAATDLLARRDASIVTVIGSGVQAATQLEAVCAVRNITRINVIGRDFGKARKFAGQMQQKLGVDVKAADDTKVVSDSHIICTATSSTDPVIDDGAVSPGTHINAIGSHKPDRRELPSKTVAGCAIYVDSISAALVEAGDIIMPLRENLMKESDIRGEIGSLIMKTIEGRRSDEEITLFKSVGNAAQDLLAARKVLLASGKTQAGTRLQL